MNERNKSGTARYATIEPLESDCPNCNEEATTRMFCPPHREGRPCNWCADRGWRVKDGRWIACEGTP